MNTNQRESPSGGRAAERRPAEGRRRDAGFSFIEVVVTIVLLGLVVVPVLAATSALIRSSAVSRSAAQVETALINAGDRVNRAPVTECDFTRYVEAAVQTQGWPADRATVSQRYRHENGWVSGPAAGPACPLQDPADPDSPPQHRSLLVKLVTIEITSPDGDITRRLQVVKSDV